MRHVAATLVRVYQAGISPLLGPCCRFHPTCSEYAIGSILSHGLAKGGWLTLRRIARCHRWHPGGYDPVPEGRGRR